MSDSLVRYYRVLTVNSLGLAVSGGVDSMALATLCADLSDEINDDDDTDVFTAFIVDHRLRKGSRDEALAVQENLYKLGCCLALPTQAFIH